MSVQPPLPLPPALMGAETGTFAHHTVTVRMPEIAARAIEENEFSSEINANIEALISEIHTGTIRQLDDPGTSDAVSWNIAIQPYLGLDWLHAPWFFTETYMYRRIIEATRYFQPGPTFRYDPYTHQKRLGLQNALEGIGELWTQVSAWVKDRQYLPEHLETLLLADLWGNQADLSIFPAGEGSQPPTNSSKDNRAQLLVDDSHAVVTDIFARSPSRRIDMVLDNAGYELCSDLALAYFLLKGNLVETIRLHIKVHPTFVSDTIHEDIGSTLAEITNNPQTRQMAKGLSRLLERDRLQVTTDKFWTSPLPAWQMDSELLDELSESSLVIFKGDANYRRLLGDLHWSFITPFTDIVSYFPVPLLAMRALKSEIASGLAPGQPERLFTRDPQWLINGKWGLLQYAP